MSLDQPFAFIIGLFDQLISFLSSITFVIGGFRVSWFYIVLGFIILSMMINSFWSGAKG